LEKEFNKEEDRFEEVRKTIGSIQSEGIYPSIVGFKRPVLSILLKLIFPLPFAAILVFVDINWITTVSVLILPLAYFMFQLFFLQKNASTKDLLNAGLVILTSYISIFLFILESKVEANYFGWAYILLLTVYASMSGLE
jgi:hypothetical protein